MLTTVQSRCLTLQERQKNEDLLGYLGYDTVSNFFSSASLTKPDITEVPMRE
jgi:hypothetical protein